MRAPQAAEQPAPDAEQAAQAAEQPSCSNIAGKHTSEAFRQALHAQEQGDNVLSNIKDKAKLEKRTAYVYAEEHVGGGDVVCLIGEPFCQGLGWTLCNSRCGQKISCRLLVRGCCILCD